MITLKELERLKELEKNATQGPWFKGPMKRITSGYYIKSETVPVRVGTIDTYKNNSQDAELIIQYRNILPKLIESFEVMKSAIRYTLDNESADHKAQQEYGGYVLDDDVRQTLAQAIGEDK